MRWVIPTIVVLIVAGCAHSSNLFTADYTYLDNPLQERIDLTFENKSNRSACLLPEFWPNRAGKIDNAPGTIYLIVNDTAFQLAAFNTGYCPTCVTKVRPGEKVEAFIGYTDFGLPDSQFHMPKELVFDLKVYNCY